MPAGVATADQIIAAAKLSKKYGIGNLHFTTRQTVEIPHIHASRLPIFYEELLASGNNVGAERGEVVNITACPGIARCKFANIDTIDMAQKIDARYFGKSMPNKVRIAISACPNSCTSETLNEIGITGICTPIRQPGYCTGCGTCVQYCQENALSVQEGSIVMDGDSCMDCGTCVKSCVYGILESKPISYRISIGGRRGRHPKVGMHLMTVNTEKAALTIIDLIVDWIYRYARFDTPIVQQIGYDLDVEKLKQSIRMNLPTEQIVL
jgi:dissimilatory sulfite reductase (desulfoviridin) alpha/beta subunit